MTGRIFDVSIRAAAVTAGLSLVLMTAAAMFSSELVMGRIMVAGDAAATTHNIIESETLFRAGILGWVVVLVCDVLAAWGLYLFFVPVSRGASLLAGWLRIVYAAMLGASIYQYIHIATMIGSEAHITAAGMDRVSADVMVRLGVFSDTWAAALIVFSFHLLFLGWLVIRSGYAPRIFGVLMMISFFGYLFDNTVNLLALDLGITATVITWIFIVPMVAGEIGLALWLLIRGHRVRTGHGDS